MPNFTFYLMNKKGLAVLCNVLQKSGPHIISSVVSSRDPEVSYDYFENISELCKTHNIPFFDKHEGPFPVADFKIAIGWRWIVKESNNLIVFHDSLLPRYRGFSPLANALINGEKKIGVTALFASDDYDKGDIIKQVELTVTYPVKIAEAIDSIIKLYEQLIQFVITELSSGKPISTQKQDESLASYSLWRDEEDYRINWSLSSGDICRFIDSVGFPYKGASAVYNTIRYRIFDAEVLPDIKVENRDVGKVIFIEDGKPVVICGKGLLKLNEMYDETGQSALPINKLRMRFH